jgi:competence protein ComEA
MKIRVALIAATVALIGMALWRPVKQVPLQAAQSGSAAPSSAAAFAEPRARRRHHDRRGFATDASGGANDAVVYVVGAVRRPGLYHLHAGARIADGVEAAGGLTAAADPAGINLAARVADGDEIDAPAAGAAAHVTAAGKHRERRRRATPPPGGVDPNTASVAELAGVPGVGRSVAARIVEMRERDGPFASLDELLDVAGMTQARLERAQPFLQSP